MRLEQSVKSNRERDSDGDQLTCRTDQCTNAKLASDLRLRLFLDEIGDYDALVLTV